MLEELPRTAADTIAALQNEANKLCASAHTVAKPKSNIPNRQLRRIKEMTNDKSIIVRPADKNLGLTVLDTTWYKTEVLKHLTDPTTYKEVDVEDIPIGKIKKELKALLVNMSKQNVITKQQWRYALASMEKYGILVFTSFPNCTTRRQHSVPVR